MSQYEEGNRSYRQLFARDDVARPAVYSASLSLSRALHRAFVRNSEDAFKNSGVVVHHTLQGLLLRSGLAGSSPWNPHRWHFTLMIIPPSVQASAI